MNGDRDISGHSASPTGEQREEVKPVKVNSTDWMILGIILILKSL